MRWFLAMALLIGGAVGVLAFVARRPYSSHAADSVRSPRIVSLLPQATEILLAMDCQDHLAAVSNFDSAPQTAHLPRVGDYQTVDWETLTGLHPQWIVTHYGAGHEPAGFLERAAAIGAKPLNLLTETLEGPDPDLTIYHAIDVLGQACNEPAKAARAQSELRASVQAVRERWKNAPRVKAIVVIGGEGTTVAGSGSFFDEALALAGGENAAAGLASRYPMIDREQLLAMKPQVILQMIPDASPQVVADARRRWDTIPDLPAVKNGRVVVFTQWYALLPGYHIGKLADEFGQALHESSQSRQFDD